VPKKVEPKEPVRPNRVVRKNERITLRGASGGGLSLRTRRFPSFKKPDRNCQWVLYQYPLEKRPTVGADLRVRPLWANP
jgi:hypothetical protein